jgi:NADPH:quinone reductase-like Zn-dependent oxidoreductase
LHGIEAVFFRASERDSIGWRHSLGRYNPHVNVRPAKTLLIHGPGGVVAAFEVQFAKAAGARVLTTAGLDNEDTLRQLALT